MDPEQIKRLIEEMQRLNYVMERGTEAFGESFRRAGEKGTTVVKELGRAWASELEDGGDAVVDVSRTVGERIADTLKRALSAANPVNIWGASLQQYGAQVRRTFDDFNRSAVQGADAAGGMFEGLRRLNQTVFAGLPFGGILGAMLFGRMQEEEYRAKAEQAGQILQRSGQVGQRIIGQLTEDIRRLEQTIPGIAQNFAAANAAIAEMGFTGRDASTEIDQGLVNARDTVLNLTVAMDRFFEVGAGESAKFAAQIAQNTNGSLKESVALVRDIGLAVQDTGISFNVMLGSVMQVTSALRLQTNELTEARDIATAIQQAQAGFRAQGITDPAAAGALAVSGIQGIAGALNNMQIGLKATMGERMTGGEVTQLEAVRRFEEGFRAQGDNAKFFQRAVGQIVELSSELGGGNINRQYQVLKSLFGLNAEQAQAILSIQKATDEGLPIEKATKQNMDALNKALRDESLKQTTFKQMMNRLIQMVAKVGASLLDVLVSGMEMLVASVTYLAKFLTVGTTTAEQAAFTQFALQGGSRVGRAGEMAFAQFTDEAPAIAKMFGETVMGRSARDRDVSRQFYREMARPDRPEQRRSLEDAVRDVLPFMEGRRQVPQPMWKPGAAGTTGAWPAGRAGAAGTWDVELDIEVPPRGTRARARGKMDLVAPPTPE